jgi:hypothetical protein
MPELQKGQTFVDGQTVNAANLNNLVDLGIALEGLISDKTDTVPAATDYILFWKGGSLFKCKFSELPAQVSSVALAMPTNELAVTGSPVTSTGTLTAAWKNQPGNKFFAGNGTGVGTTPTFRLLGAEDMAIASVVIAATTIDWSLGNVFFKQLVTSSTSIGFVNVQDGQTIQVLINQDGVGGRTVGFPSHLWWRGGAYPVQAKVANTIDIWTFTAYGSGVLGKGDMGYAVID